MTSPHALNIRVFCVVQYLAYDKLQRFYFFRTSICSVPNGPSWWQEDWRLGAFEGKGAEPTPQESKIWSWMQSICVISTLENDNSDGGTDGAAPIGKVRFQ